MLKVVDIGFQPEKSDPSLSEIARHIRQANDQLAKAGRLLGEVDLEDRAKLQFAIMATMAKMGLVVAALVHEASPKPHRGTPAGE